MTSATTSKRPVLFLDCDDCLYQNDWKTAVKITVSIGAYTKDKLGLSKEEAYELYKIHGTCLKGLLAEGLIDEDGAETFLREVHDIDYSDIDRDDALRNVLEQVTSPMYIFTASASEHAQRCLDAIGISDLPFRGIIDTRTCNLETKHSRSSFLAAMAAAGVSDPSLCVLCDDSVKNVRAAKEVGWHTVLVGLNDRDTGALIQCHEADAHIASMLELQTAVPDVFLESHTTVDRESAVPPSVRWEKDWHWLCAGAASFWTGPVKLWWRGMMPQLNLLEDGRRRQVAITP